MAWSFRNAIHVGLIVFITACGGADRVPTREPSLAAQTPTETLRLHGSSTIGDVLAPELAKAYLEHLSATDVHVQDERANTHRYVIEGSLPDKRLTIEIVALGSRTAFEDLGDGLCDIGMSSRPIHDDEAAKLRTLGDFTSYRGENIIGLDGIDIVVHPSSRVSRLTLPQLEGIFTGAIRNWSELGGAAGPIHVFARDDKSGTADLFSNVVLKGHAVSAPGATIAPSTSIAAAVVADPNAIGYLGAGLVKNAKTLAVGDHTSQALLPTTLNVTTEDYALSRRLFLYLPEKPAATSARSFVDFALSDDGQAVVERAGYFSMLIRPQSQPSAPQHSVEYLKFTAGAQRLPLNFRFRAGKPVLDSKAYRDLDRVASFVKRGARLEALVGFSDDRGDEAKNVELSQERASIVAKELEKRGISAKQIGGLGSLQPVGSNQTSEGRERNRRVEVWVRSFLRNHG